MGLFDKILDLPDKLLDIIDKEEREKERKKQQFIDTYSNEYEKWKNEYLNILEKYKENKCQHYFVGCWGMGMGEPKCYVMFDNDTIKYVIDFTDYYGKLSKLPTLDKLYDSYLIKINEKPNFSFPTLTSNQFDEIPSYERFFKLDDIKFYQTIGSVHNEQTISGGGGGGSSLKGAIVGGVIAGGAGAIIGSRQKVNEIKSNNYSVDDRETEITFNNGKKLCIKGLEFYTRLLDIIPEKDYENYVKSKENKGNPKNNNYINELKELKHLLDEGVISQEEFEKKKQQILGI